MNKLLSTLVIFATIIMLVALQNTADGELRVYEMYKSQSIETGDEVVWRNMDNMAHTITSGTANDGPSNYFNSYLLQYTDTFSQVFSDAGTFDYFCMIHPWETGIITVIATTEPLPTPLEEQNSIPSWVRLIFQGWLDGQITDDEFKNAITFLINNGIIQLDS